MTRPHLVVIHRWRAPYAEYARYADHDAYAVTYVTTAVGADGVPPAATDLALVAATDDLPAVTDAVGRLADKHGPPAAIVGLKEDDLLVAARLRSTWGCPGPSAPTVTPFRDKLVMAGRVRAAGLAVPAFAPASSAADVAGFGRAHSWPVIVKPRVGSSSAGVVRADGPIDPPPYALVQAFDPRPIHHVDGVFDGSALGPWRASRYLNTCLGFREGDPLGSVEEDDRPLNEMIGDFSVRVLAALTDRPTVFHLELFVGDGSCAFLEVGARAGGAEIPFLWRDLHGYDLMEAAFRLQMGLPLPPAAPRGDEIGGWLLAPAPAARPCRITAVTPMLGRDPGPYAESLLAPGEILPAADAYYEHVGGRFRFRGTSTAAVRAAIEATARDFRVAAEPLGQPTASCCR